MLELIVLCFTAGLLIGSLITWFIIDINAYYKRGGRS